MLVYKHTNWNLKQVCQQGAYPANVAGGVQLNYGQYPPPLQGQHFHRPLYASIYSTQGIENDVPTRLPNITSVSSDLDL